MRDTVESLAELLLYSVENPNEKTEKIRREAYELRYGTEFVTEVVYAYRMNLVIADMHLHLARVFLLQAGWHEGKGLLPTSELTRAADRIGDSVEEKP